MKKTIKINLNQQLFDLDADAYERLKKYLDSLGEYLRKSDTGAEEILQDIEQRIAEILTGKLQKTKQVVTLEDIDHVIHLMGTEADFADSFDPENVNDHGRDARDKDPEFDRQSRRLFRDIENNMIGGVCSGLAAYFNVDPVWIRLAFVVLFFINLVGLIVYLILWVVVPPAITTAQKLQMRGIPVTIGNIHDSVKSEFNKVKENFRSYTKSESYKRTRDSVVEIVSVLGDVVLTILKIVLIVIGVSLLVAVIAVILVFTGVFSAGFHDWNLPEIFNPDNLHPVFHDINLFSVSLALVIIIPVIAMLTFIIRLIFNVNTRNNILSAFAWTIWALALVFLIVGFLIDPPLRHSYKETYPISIQANKPLYIACDERSISDAPLTYYTIFGKQIKYDKWNDNLYLTPKVQIKPWQNNYAEMEIVYHSAFSFLNEDFRRDLNFNWMINDSIISIDDCFTIDDEDIWMFPGVTTTIYVPDNQILHINGNLSHILIDKEMIYGTFTTLK